MKSIPNRQYTVPVDEKKTPGTTALLLAIVINRPPQGGFTVQQMRERNRILDVAEKCDAGGTMKFEDSDYKVAQQLVGEAVWPINHKDLLAFSEQFQR